MTIINRATMAFAFTVLSIASVSAQRPSIPPVPVTPQSTRTQAVLESAEVKRCRLHCGALAATPNWKTLPSASVTQMRDEACGREMIRNR